MDWSQLFERLLQAEEEDEVTTLLNKNGLLNDDTAWQVLGDAENNFSIVGNQHAEPTGAFVEKIINSIDAVLMAACFSRGIDPEGSKAPPTMAAAVEQFFAVKGGRLGTLTAERIRELVDNIHVVATGAKDAPSYLIIDRGEGQTPERFPSTFLSLAKSNKLRIPFVQGKFNAGGTGVLQFCGTENYQLIASRRHPAAPVAGGDKTRDLWGFTIIRRVEPAEGDARRNSMYMYLAPGHAVPTFRAGEVKVLPGASRKNEPAAPYLKGLSHGTIVKLYNYRWKARSIATTEARYELEKYLHSPCLPFRVTETRDYRANYYSTTVLGVWASISSEGDAGAESNRVEDGFPAQAGLNLDHIGHLDYRIAVFKEDVDSRRVPHGVFFAVNGQVHGELPADFVARRLEFDHLRGHLLVSVDCTGMRTREREDFFPASRDRIRRNEVYDEIVSRLESDLKSHPGLRALNASRRAKALEKALGEQEDIIKTFQDLLKMDPAMRALFALGDRLVTKVGPTEPPKFEGRRFPSYFRLAGDPKGTVVKPCPVNRSCRVEFETDACNDYFDRTDSPGEIVVKPLTALEYSHLWNGVYSTRFRAPKGARPGDSVSVSVAVTDPDRASRGKPPFHCEFTLLIGKPDSTPTMPGGGKNPQGPRDGDRERPGLAVPNVIDVRKSEWTNHTPPFTEYDALRVQHSGDGGHDFLLNLDNTYLLTELNRAKEEEKQLVTYWFKWGLVLSGMGMLQHARRLEASSAGSTNGNGTANDAGADILELISQSSRGIASVIIPIVRNLRKGPPSPG